MRHNLNKEPKFHMEEIFTGAGKSIKVLFNIFNNGSFLRNITV